METEQVLLRALREGAARRAAEAAAERRGQRVVNVALLALAGLAITFSWMLAR